MKKSTLAIAMFSSAILLQTTNAQITFTTDKFSKTETNLSDLDVSKVDDLGFTIPVNEKIKKYDKITVSVHYKKLEGDDESFKRSNNSLATYYPKSPAYLDNYSDKNKMKFYLISNDDGNIIKLTQEGYFTEVTPFAYKVVVDGYFSSGTETVWNDYREAFETKNIYTYSKEVYTSSEITFIQSQEAIDKVNASAQIQEQFEEYDRIHKELRSYIAPAYRILAARCYNSCANEIRTQKKKCQSDQDAESLKELIKLETKFLEIFNNKGAKNLHMKVNKLSDYEEIKKVVFEF